MDLPLWSVWSTPYRVRNTPAPPGKRPSWHNRDGPIYGGEKAVGGRNFRAERRGRVECGMKVREIVEETVGFGAMIPVIELL